MLHKAWNSKGEMSCCFPRSSIKFQGHTGQNITYFDTNWTFPDNRPVAAFKSPRFALLLKQELGHRLGEVPKPSQTDSLGLIGKTSFRGQGLISSVLVLTEIPIRIGGNLASCHLWVFTQQLLWLGIGVNAYVDIPLLISNDTLVSRAEAELEIHVVFLVRINHSFLFLKYQTRPDQNWMNMYIYIYVFIFFYIHNNICRCSPSFN